MSTSKKVIYFDADLHQIEETRQTRLQSLFDTMLEEARKAILKVDDYKAFIEDPIQYCIDSYWDANASFFPAGVTKEKAIKGTDFNEVKISHALSEYRQLNKTSKGLKVSKTSHAKTINKEDYNRYLADDKKAKYEALEQFLKAVEGIEKHSVLNHRFIQRAVGFDCFLIDNNSRLEINHNTFR